MVAPLHEIYPVRITHGGGPTTFYINQLDNVDVQPGIELLEAMAGGSLDPQVIATAFAENKIGLTSRDVATILASISMNNGLIFATSTVQWEKRLNGGAYMGSTNHASLTSTGGLIYPKEITCKQDDKEAASITLDLCPYWDGTNFPIVYNTAHALVGSVAANALHAMGPVVFEGTQLVGVQSMTAKSGIEVKFVRADGELFARLVPIMKRKPTIEIECLNVPFAGTLTLGTTYPMSVGCAAYLQKVIPGGGRFAYSEDEHIAIGATTGTYRLDSISGSKGDNGTLKLTIMPTLGSMTVNSASVIDVD